MIPGGMPKTRISPRAKDSRKPLFLSLTLVLFIIGALAIMMFTDKDDAENSMSISNSMNTLNNNDASDPSDVTNNDFENASNTKLEQKPNDEIEKEPEQPEFFIHELKSNETYSTLAAKYYKDGRKFLIIQKANPNLDPRKLQIGTKIKIPNINKKKSENNNNPTNSAPPINKKKQKTNNDGGFTIWNETEPQKAETKKETSKKVNGSSWWDDQEQPSVPDDQNVGTMKKVVICKQTSHIASQGDTAMSLAIKYYGSINLKSLIEDANPMIDWFNLKGGERIVIPEYSENRVVAPKPEKDLTNRRDETTGEPIVNVPPEKKSSTSEYEIYIVKDGESLWKIAEAKLGNGARYKEIMELNGMTSDRVNKGMRLKLPKK